MSKKLTITIESNGVGVGVKMEGTIGNHALIQGTAMIINQVCEITKLSRMALFGCAALEAEHKPVAATGTCVTIKGGAGDE